MNKTLKKEEWCALSTYLRDNNLKRSKDITPEKLIQELKIEWKVGSYKFKKSDLAIAVAHYKIPQTVPKPPQHRGIDIYVWADKYYVFVVQNKLKKTSDALNRVLRRIENVKFKEMILEIENLYNEDYYPLFEFWNRFKDFLKYFYDTRLVEAIRDEMSITEGSRIFIVPQDMFSTELINKLKETKQNQK